MPTKLRSIAGVVLTLSVTTSAAAQLTGTRMNRNEGAVNSVTLNDPKSAVRASYAYSQCLARREGRRMRLALDLPFTSAEQSAALKRTQDQFDECLGASPDYDRLESSDLMLAGAAAEWFVTKELKKIDLQPLKGMSDEALEKSDYKPRTSIEDLGLCIVRRDPARVRAALDTRPTSSEESTALKSLTSDVVQCVAAGNTMRLNKSNLRAVVAYALYRAASKLGATGA